MGTILFSLKYFIQQKFYFDLFLHVCFARENMYMKRYSYVHTHTSTHTQGIYHYPNVYWLQFPLVLHPLVLTWCQNAIYFTGLRLGKKITVSPSTTLRVGLYSYNTEPWHSFLLSSQTRGYEEHWIPYQSFISLYFWQTCIYAKPLAFLCFCFNFPFLLSKVKFPAFPVLIPNITHL